MFFPCFLSVCSQVFGLLLWIVCWTDLFYTFHELRQGHTQPPIFFVTPLVLGMTMVSIMCIQKQLHKNLNLEKKPLLVDYTAKCVIKNCSEKRENI